MTLALLAVAFLAGQASAAPATQAWTGQAAGTTPDLRRDGLELRGVGGVVTTQAGIAGTLNFTLDGVPYTGYSTDASRVFSPDPESVETTVQDPPGTATARAVTWIILNRTPTGPTTLEKAQLGAVSQVAIWLLADGGIDTDVPTGDSALGTAAKALVQESLAATASAATVALSASAPAGGSPTSLITVTGRPGATVALAITSGSGTLSAAQVTLDAAGSATVTLTVTGPGTVGLSATAAGDGRLISIRPTSTSKVLPASVAATPTTITAGTEAVFPTVVPTTPSPGVTPSVPATIPNAPVALVVPSLSITKSGPARATVLTKVSYRITLKNTGTVALTNVVLRDRLPRGLSFVKASRASTLSGGNAQVTIGRLAPGASRTVIVTLMADASVTGSRTNTATASATGVRPRSARAVTVFRPRVRRVQPAVTG